MEALKARGITPELTLSDKDQSDINVPGQHPSTCYAYGMFEEL